MTTTSTQRLMDAALGGRGRLREYVEGRRAEGRSWRQVTLDLHRDFDIEVSHETLRSWFPDLTEPPAIPGEDDPAPTSRAAS